MVGRPGNEAYLSLPWEDPEYSCRVCQKYHEYLEHRGRGRWWVRGGEWDEILVALGLTTLFLLCICAAWVWSGRV